MYQHNAAMMMGNQQYSNPPMQQQQPGMMTNPGMMQQQQTQAGMMNSTNSVGMMDPNQMNPGMMQQQQPQQQQQPGMHQQQQPGMMPPQQLYQQQQPGMMQQQQQPGLMPPQQPQNPSMMGPQASAPSPMMMNNHATMPPTSYPQQPQQPGINHYNMGGVHSQYQPQQQTSKIYAYEASEDVEGMVVLRLPPTSLSKGVEHLGLSVQFIGRIDMGGSHEGKPHYDFISLKKELAPPGILAQPEIILPFTFRNIDKELESYRGRNVSVRYLVRVKMERKFFPPLSHDHEVWVQILRNPPIQQESIKMEVGIEECLHIEFEYDRRHYHLHDTIRGKIRFMLVSIKLKHMELAVLRRETSGEGVAAAAGAANPGNAGGGDNNGNICTETQTLVKYEIMDGAPVKGEVIPVKLCLDGIPADVTPTFAAHNNRFSVRYYLNLVLVDEDDRRYFKQQEIVLWRKELG